MVRITFPISARLKCWTALIDSTRWSGWVSRLSTRKDGSSTPSRASRSTLKRRTPYAYVVSNNIRRRHLNGEQKRELIAQLLKLYPGKSDNAIGKEVGAHNETIAAVRKAAIAQGDVTESVTRTDTKGRQQPAKKPPKSKATPGQGIITAEQRKADYAADEAREEAAKHDPAKAIENAQLDHVEQNINLNSPADPSDSGAVQLARNPDPPTPKASSASPGRPPRPATPRSASSSPRPHRSTTRAEIAEAWLYAPHDERARFISDLGKDLFNFIPDDWLPAVTEWLSAKQFIRVLN